MSRAVLNQALEALRERTDRQIDHDLLVRGLGAWLGLAEPPPTPPRPPVWAYQDVALLGVAATVPEAGGDFAEGVAWLQACRFFRPGAPGGFETDPLAVFGVAVGLVRLGEDGGWLLQLAEQARGMERDPWRSALLDGVRGMLGGTVTWTESNSAVGVALESRGVVELGEEVRGHAFRQALALHHHDEGCLFDLVAVQRALRLAGSIDLHRPTVDDLVRILRAVPAGMKRWPWEDAPKTRKNGVTAQRWDLQVEDHVQALLYAILRPLFTDIDDEEYLKSLGQKQPRTDFVIPSLRLVIEVKFLREATQSARAAVIEGVSADTGLYLNDGTDYDKMVAFVWDDTGSVNHHAELEAGLRRLPGVVDAVVVSRPGSWKR